MVFDGDQEESPRQGTKHRGHDRDDAGKRKNTHRERREQEMVDWDRYDSRSKGRYERSTRDVDYLADRKDREKHTERRRDDGYDLKDDRDSRRRNTDDSRLGERRTYGDHRRKTDSSHVERRDEREYGRDGEKRNKNGLAGDGHEDRRRMDDRDHRKRFEDRGRQDTRNESRARKRSPDNDDADYRHPREEHGHRKRRDIESNDDRHGRHHSDRR